MSRKRDELVGRLVRAARVFRHSQTLKSCRELDKALKAFDGEYESPEGREGGKAWKTKIKI